MNIRILLGVVIVLAAVSSAPAQEKKGETFIINGVIENDPPKAYNPMGCGYCFTSDDGKYKCVLMTGKAFPTISSTGVATNLDEYVGKNVTLHARDFKGASTLMCPIALDVDKIELRDKKEAE
jgi:hypothetical protein